MFSLYKNGTARFGLFDVNLKIHKTAFFIQALLGGSFILLSFLALSYLLDRIGVAIALEDSLTTIRTFVIGSIAASTFLVFGAPHLGSSAPSKIIMGHLIAVIVGLLTLYLSSSFIGATNIYPTITLAAGISVVSTIFFMTILNFEHPPAAGTALALATHSEQFKKISGSDIYSILLISGFVITVSLFLGIIRQCFYDEHKSLRSIEGLGGRVFSELNAKGITTISDLERSGNVKKL